MNGLMTFSKKSRKFLMRLLIALLLLMQHRKKNSKLMIKHLEN